MNDLERNKIEKELRGYFNSLKISDKIYKQLTPYMVNQIKNIIGDHKYIYYKKNKSKYGTDHYYSNSYSMHLKEDYIGRGTKDYIGNIKWFCSVSNHEPVIEIRIDVDNDYSWDASGYKRIYIPIEDILIERRTWYFTTVKDINIDYVMKLVKGIENEIVQLVEGPVKAFNVLYK